MMKTFEVPEIKDVSEVNQGILDTIKKSMGFVPNLFATFAYSDNALKNYLDLANGATSLSTRDKVVVSLVVSQVNDCAYCLAANSAAARHSGFSDNEILEIRKGYFSSDNTLDALVVLAKNIAENRGSTAQEVIDMFFNEGWTKENLIDIVVLTGYKTLSNYIHKTTRVPLDFPEASPL